tara:strand:+ start:915 stop:1148 length:234 start_codon:yes stop_codon:yes gene_type:complete
MSKLFKVEGHVDLVRDEYSNAIINTNQSEYKKYMQRQRAMQKNRDEIRCAVREINTLKQELFEIKSLIKELVGKNGR